MINCFCTICNISLKRRNYSKTGNYFCSFICQGKYKSLSQLGEKNPYFEPHVKEIAKKCPICHNIFYGNPSKLKYKKTCSLGCGKKLHKITAPKKEAHPKWKGGKLTKKCSICGNDFNVKKYHYDRAVCCSRKCLSAWQSLNQIGENSPTWKGGISYIKYNKIWKKRGFREQIRQLDKFICFLCGDSNSKDVHHINYIKHDCSPLNLITLCKKCHTVTTSNRLFWKTFIQSTVIFLKKHEKLNLYGRYDCFMESGVSLWAFV